MAKSEELILLDPSTTSPNCVVTVPFACTENGKKAEKTTKPTIKTSIERLARRKGFRIASPFLLSAQ